MCAEADEVGEEEKNNRRLKSYAVVDFVVRILRARVRRLNKILTSLSRTQLDAGKKAKGGLAGNDAGQKKSRRKRSKRKREWGTTWPSD